MPGPVASRASLRTFALAALAAVPLLLWSACTTATGATPECISDTTDAGIQPTDGGCSGFAVCRDGNGNPADPMTCCADIKDNKALQTCLFTYGAAPPPDNSGSGSGGGSSSSSSSSSSSGSSSSSSGSGMMDGGKG